MVNKYPKVPMSKERLEEKRKHAVENPSGRTAELMGHIDWLQEKLDKLERRWDNVVGSLPVSLSDDELDED